MKLTDITDTKTKILFVANELFATKGYEGTSIRDIAKEAEVNLASINYHYKNKENLYLAVFEANYEWMEQAVKEIVDNGKVNTKEFVEKLFNLFLENGHCLMNSFKILLTDSVNFPEQMESPTKTFGPPGGVYLLEVIRNDVGPKVSETACHWAMRMLYADLVHFGVVMGTSYVKSQAEKIPFLKPENKIKDLHHLVDSLLSYIKNNPQKL